MCLSKLISSKFDHRGVCREKTVGANCIELVVENQVVLLFSFGVGQHSSLQVNCLLDYSALGLYIEGSGYEALAI